MARPPNYRPAEGYPEREDAPRCQTCKKHRVHDGLKSMCIKHVAYVGLYNTCDEWNQPEGPLRDRWTPTPDEVEILKSTPITHPH